MAARTAHLGAHHPVRAVLDELDGIRRDGLGEARPAGARVVLRAALEEHVAAGGTVVELLIVSVDVLPGERERSEEHTSELQSRQYLVCRLLLEKKKK